MVSRLLNSLSGILNSSGTNLAPEANNDKTPESNEPEVKEPTSNNESLKLRRKDSGKKGIEVLDAESLDRAIVHRLQSKTSRITTSVSGHKDFTSSHDLGLRIDNLENGLEFRASHGDKQRVRMHSATSIPGTHTPPYQLQELTPEVPENKSSHHEETFKAFINHLDSKTEVVPKFTTEENRNIMYKNSQFNFDDSSKDVFSSESTRMPLEDGDFADGANLNLPMFGIPDTSMYFRRSSLTSSTESLHGTDGKMSTGSLYLNPHDIKLLRARSRSKSPSSKSDYAKKTFSEHLSSTKMGEKLFEETMNEVIEKGGEDFKCKYSSWIWDMFHAHLLKMKSVLLAEFNQKLKDTIDEREVEVSELQQKYRDKLAEFDVTTEGFQKMVDDLYKENQKVLRAKDFVIEKLKKEFLECKRHFEQDLVRQLQSYRKEAEVEKLELQKRNDELMKIMLTDTPKYGLEDAFKREIESLHKMIKALTTKNELLHQRLEEGVMSTSKANQMALLQPHSDAAKAEILELRKKIQYASREKEDLAISHHEEIAKLNRKIQETNTRYDRRVQEAAEDMESLRKKHAKEVKELKQRLASQESDHAQILNHLKQHYGLQVESLSKVVAQLQSELTSAVAGGLNSTKFC